ncbi:MAG: histidinol-phosphatase HisJ family protein [Bacillota bacterium]
MPVDYHVHAMGHGEGIHSPEILKQFIQTAVQRGVRELGFSEHDWYLEQVDTSQIRKVAATCPGVAVLVGLEVDHAPGREAEIAAMLAGHDWDYLIGSVHQIGGWMFDHPDYFQVYGDWDPDELYATYFKLVENMVKTGLYDIVGHLDLVKINRCRPRKDVLELVDPLLRVISASGMVVEINTNGLYKPVQEFYPQKQILSRCFEYDIPITLGSDAHQADAVGRSFAEALELARGVGYRQVTGFYRRVKHKINID